MAKTKRPWLKKNIDRIPGIGRNCSCYLLVYSTEKYADTKDREAALQ